MTSIQRATNWLLSSNLRPTRQRLVLAEILVGDGKHRHVTAESLFEQVNKRADKVSLATVYNTLHTFCDAGLVQEITLDGSKSYFDTRTNDHTDAPADQLKISELPNAPKGAEIASVDVIIRLRRK